jgi:hypothetical protein
MPTIKLSNGDVYAVSDDFQGVEYLPPARTERHCFDHSFMHQDRASYPIDSALRCVGDWVESLGIGDDDKL